MVYSKLVSTLIAFVAILFVSFFVRDWYVLHECGAVQSCLDSTSLYCNAACIYDWQAFSHQARPLLFADGLLDDPLRRFLFQDSVQLFWYARNSRKFYHAWHRLFLHGANDFNLSTFAYKEYGLVVPVDLLHSVCGCDCDDFSCVFQGP